MEIFYLQFRVIEISNNVKNVRVRNRQIARIRDEIRRLNKINVAQQEALQAQ